MEHSHFNADPPLHSFVFTCMLIRPTTLILKQIFFRNVHAVARLGRLIAVLALKQTNILFGRYYERGQCSMVRFGSYVR